MAAHRYWAINIKTCAAGVFGALSKVEMATSAGGTNLCTSGAACFASSSQGGAPPSNALLGVSYWGGAGPLPVQWWYDFGSAVDITEVRITSVGGLTPYHPDTWDLQYSDDASTWTVTSSYTSAAWVAGVQQVFTVVSVTPSGALGFTGFAPTLPNSGIIRLTQIAAEAWVSNHPALLLTQIAAEVWRSVTDVVPPGALGFAGFAPTSSIEIAIPGSGSLQFTGFAPAAVSAATPAAGTLSFTGFAPTSSIVVAEPGAGAVLITGFAPLSVDAATPAAGSLVFTGFAPTSTALSANSPLFSIIL